MPGLMQPMLDSVSRINTQCNALGAPIFSWDVTVDAPKGAHPELDFLRCVSWLFVFWFECAVNSTRILAEASRTFGIVGYDDWKRHKRAVEAIRTLNQHSIRADSKRGQQLLADSQEWFSETISTPLPNTLEHYKDAFTCLIDEAVGGISMFERCLCMIDTAVFREVSSVSAYGTKLAI
jgi:hypothetical protein